MKIGIPREIKILEGRVALTPSAVRELAKRGHQIYVEHNAGLLSGYHDHEYSEAGALMQDTAKAVYDSCELIVKVKEPQISELVHFREDHILFSFLHLAAEPNLTTELQKYWLNSDCF